jgi:phenylacetate-CoA ligase
MTPPAGVERDGDNDMTDHFDALETRDPAERDADLFARLPEVLRKAMAAPAYAGHLRGVDPAAVTSRAALARLPLLRKSDLPALHKAAPPFGGLVPGLPSNPSPSMPIPGAARGRCSPQASGRATSCSTPSAIT